MRTLVLAPFALVLAGCAAHDLRGDPTGPDASDEGGLGVGDAGPSTDHGCSGDLQSVVDHDGAIVMQCPPDQGCANGACVAACDAAAANKGTMGCDFVVATPSFYPMDVPPCFAVFVANNWGKAVSITLTRAGSNYDVTKFGRIPVAGQPETSWPSVPVAGVPPGQVAVLFISSDPLSRGLTCPVPVAINASTAVYSGTSGNSTGRGQAFHLVTDVPVTSYDILPYGGASSYLPSAELLLPTTAWGTNYLGIVPRRGSASPQWGQIVASRDDTTVQIVPNVALPGGANVAPAPANVITTYTLAAGEYVQWQESSDMSSTVIASNKPIGFNGGLGYACYTSATSTGGGCDSAHQAIPPISALGFEYVAAPFATRRADLLPESIPYRFVGAVNGTTLTYDPPVSNAPGSLSRGQVVDFETTLAFHVTAQDKDHPFYVAQMMSGCTMPGGTRPGVSNGWECLGDEEFVNVLPPAQFLQRYVFFTDPTYATTNLVFVRQKTAAGFQDVVLDCFGNVTGWQPLGASGRYEITNVDLVRANVPNGNCGNGPHTAQSKGPFGLTVWGLDFASSYAYPAGGNVATINTVIVPPTPN